DAAGWSATSCCASQTAAFATRSSSTALFPTPGSLRTTNAALIPVSPSQATDPAARTRLAGLQWPSPARWPISRLFSATRSLPNRTEVLLRRHDTAVPGQDPANQCSPFGRLGSYQLTQPDAA